MALSFGADIIVASHGAALSWQVMLATHRRGIIIEVLPWHLSDELTWCPEVWGLSTLGMVGGLARLTGIDHVCVRSYSGKAWQNQRVEWGQTQWKKRNYAVDTNKLCHWVTSAV